MRALVAGIIAVALGVFALIGWAIHHEVNEPDSGTVTELEYVPAITTVTCSPVGKVTVCTPHTTPECYRIEYDNGDDWGDTCVSPREYALYRVGDHYPKEM